MLTSCHIYRPLRSIEVVVLPFPPPWCAGVGCCRSETGCCPSMGSRVKMGRWRKLISCSETPLWQTRSRWRLSLMSQVLRCKNTFLLCSFVPLFLHLFPNILIPFQSLWSPAVAPSMWSSPRGEEWSWASPSAVRPATHQPSSRGRCCSIIPHRHCNPHFESMFCDP